MKKSSFVPMPPGDCRAHAGYPYDLEDKPKLRFFQPVGSRICLTTSFANCFYFCDCRNHAGMVFNNQKLTLRPDAMHLFKEFLVTLSGLLKHKNLVQLEISQLSSDFYNQAVVTCIKGSDGKEDHTIAIYSGWIFDGTFTHALPLSRESLDHCCLSDDVACHFVSFVNPFVLPYFEEYVKKHNQGSKQSHSKKVSKKKKRLKKKKNIYHNENS